MAFSFVNRIMHRAHETVIPAPKDKKEQLFNFNYAEKQFVKLERMRKRPEKDCENTA